MAYFFKTTVYPLIFICLFTACISSKQTVLHPCGAYFRAGDKLLMPEMGKVTYGQSYYYFNQVRDEMNACGLSLHYVPENEYDFQVEGIKDPMASENLPLLEEKFGFSHLLIIEITKLQDAKGSFEHYTAYEKNQQERLGSPDDGLEKKAFLNFKIFTVEGMKMIYNLSVETTVNSMIFKDDDDGENEVNLGSTGMATAKAIKKGAKKITKDCGCSK